MILTNRLYIVDCNKTRDTNLFEVVYTTYHNTIYKCFKGSISECAAFLKATNEGSIIMISDLPETEQKKFNL